MGPGETAEKRDAQQALFAEISRQVGEVSKTGDGSQTSRIKQLALAYRYAAGGAQPGSAAEK